jgi:hypothetical protein
LWRLTPTIARADGKPMAAGWQLASVQVHVWGDRGAVVTPALPAGPVGAGGSVEMSVTVEDAGLMPWSAEEFGPQFGEAGVDPATRFEAAWIDASGRVVPAIAPVDLVSASGGQQQLALSLLAPALPGSYTLHFDVRDAQGSLLAPEDSAENVPLVVGPAPVMTLPPASNQ